MNYLKWAKGAQNKDWFVSNGTPISSNTFNVTEKGIHTVYYETVNGEKRVYTFNVTQNDLPSNTKLYELIIDESNTNPATALTYAGNATGFTPSSYTLGSTTISMNSWDNIFPYNQIKPCVVKNDGTVNYYLNPNDYTKKIDGTASVLSGADGQVMVEFPKVYWKIEKTGKTLKISMSDSKVDSTFQCPAHTQQGVEYDKLYISAYHVYADYGNVLGSYSNFSINYTGVTPAQKTISTWRSFISSQVGEKFRLYDLNTQTMLQILYLFQFKNRNSQDVLGKGRTDTTSSLTTGAGNKYGMYYGTADYTTTTKIFGLENMWGTASIFLDGIYVNPTTQKTYICPPNGDIRNESEYVELPYFGSYIGYMTETSGNPLVPFFPSVGLGSATTAYCDSNQLSMSNSGMKYFTVSGNYLSKLNAGIFTTGLVSDSSQACKIILRA